jgi:hypothetical protein
MADEVVVKHNKDGTVTVCIGDRCVTVPGAEPEEERVGGPIIDVQRVRKDVLGDIEKLTWDKADANEEIARDQDGALLSRREIH